MTDEGVESTYVQKRELSMQPAYHRIITLCPGSTLIYAPVSRCFQNEIGFGRYHLKLFILSGIGWMADSLMLLLNSYPFD